MRRSTIFWVLLILLAGGGLIRLKMTVQALEAEQTRLAHQLREEQEALHVLAAEWNYLNRPQWLAELSRRHLDLQAVGPEQIIDIEDIPMAPARNLIAQGSDVMPTPRLKGSLR